MHTSDQPAPKPRLHLLLPARARELQMDTEGSEVHISDLPAPIKADKAAEFTFTVRDPASCGPNCFAVRCGTTRGRSHVRCTGAALVAQQGAWQ